MRILIFIFTFLYLNALSSQKFIGHSTPFFMNSPQIADIDNDGDVDVVAIEDISFGESSAIIILYNNDNTVEDRMPEVLLESSDLFGGLSVADIDLDGDLDILYQLGDTLALHVLKNVGESFEEPENLGVEGSNNHLLLDSDNDNDMDILGFYDKSLILHVHNANGTYSSSVIYSAEQGIEDVALSDIDNDGDIDIWVSYEAFGDGVISYFKNDGSGVFEEVFVYTNFSRIQNIAVIDINGDAIDDLVGIVSSRMVILQNDGNGAFERVFNEVIEQASFTNPLRELLVGDFNGDGKTDLVTGSNGDSTLLHLNNYNDNVVSFDVFGVGRAAPTFSLKAGDLDGDEDLDIILSNGDLWWFENNLEQETTPTIEIIVNKNMVTPNPTSNLLTIKNDFDYGSHYTIVNLNGQLVKSGILSDELMDISTLQPGIYCLEIYSQDNQTKSISRFVKAN